VPTRGVEQDHARELRAQPAAATLRKIPGNYYVNVHTATYPDGAARGQLSEDDD
jgi:hypothetical protein